MGASLFTKKRAGSQNPERPSGTIFPAEKEKCAEKKGSRAAAFSCGMLWYGMDHLAGSAAPAEDAALPGLYQITKTQA
jgi:hypothetical protein